MVMKEIVDFDSPEFEQCIKIYKSSFPLNETRAVERVVTMLKDDLNYHLFISKKNNSVVGMSLMYIFKSLKIGLLDYMAIISTYRGRGIGKELFKFTFDKFCSLINNGIGLLMEIQIEEVNDPEENAIRKNRIRFYTRLGAKLLEGVNYLLPQFQNGIMPENMYLMIRPIEDIPYLSKVSVVGYICAIYSSMYQNHCNNLLAKVSQNLPSRIMLRTIEV
jgi:GNAT superfamily N-acetyltransferase